MIPKPQNILKPQQKPQKHPQKPKNSSLQKNPKASNNLKNLRLLTGLFFEPQIKTLQPGLFGFQAAIYFMKGRWFLKAVNGPVTIESQTLHTLKDSDGKAPKRYTSTSGFFKKKCWGDGWWGVLGFFVL